MSTGTGLQPFLQAIRIKLFALKPPHPPQEYEAALRSELFSAEQMAAHGKELAAMHTLRETPGPDLLLPRLDENENVIMECSKRLSSTPSYPNAVTHIPPAGEWLLDNYWMVAEQVHTTRKHLPKQYSTELPQIASGPSAGLPRVYEIALESISHGDGRLDIQSLTRFVMAYQEVSPLTLGELWAIPIMLRLALIENLRRVATRIMAAWMDQSLAVKWADALIETVSKDRKSVVLTVAEMAASRPPITSAFIAALARRLQGQSALLAMPLHWIEELLEEAGSSVDKMIQLDTQGQASDQVSVSNSINSLRMLSAMDWREFVENVSLVDHSLREDPAGTYALMDFSSRDHYRHVIESLGRLYNLREDYVAATAVDLASKNRQADPRLLLDAVEEKDKEQAEDQIRHATISSHVGFYLIDNGLPALKNLLAQGGPAAPVRLPRRNMYRARVHPREQFSLAVYLCVILLLTIALTAPFVLVLNKTVPSMGWLVFGGIIALLATSQTALKIVNWSAALCVKPHFIPRLDYSYGLPPEARTVVVIPTLIGDMADVTELLEKLEVHYLGNRVPNVQFGLLTDFKDSDEEHQAGDERLLEQAKAGIEVLNRKYPGQGCDNFFLCHRPRRWNEGEGKWMGHERKRGKLCEFNKLLRGQGAENYVLIVGNTLQPHEGVYPVRYVITLDSDTQLPRGSARKLVGAMYHPLNRPLYDKERGRITSGYAIIQPRVAVTLTSGNRSRYAKLFCWDAGIDPYTREVSDTYQDLFHHASYIGKGIYEVDAFELAVDGKFPDNTILSHDLVESCYARSCLLNKVTLYEDHPHSYSADVKRRARWIRGDWQLLPWLLPRVPVKGGGRERNPITILSRWKIFDNMRRSLHPAAVLLLFIMGWLFAATPFLWTLGILGLTFLMPILRSIWSLTHNSGSLSFRSHASIILRVLAHDCWRLLLSLVWLPHEVAYSLSAAGRTLWRILVSRRNLLQWNTSADAERTSANSLAGYYREMWFAPALALGLSVLLPILSTAGLVVALPFLLAWFLCPAVAWKLSTPKTKKEFVPTFEQNRFLRSLTRRTWAFFEEFVGPEENWLPPDNIQEQPALVVAHRTSPTNMGMALLAHLSAHDFGYLHSGHMLERLGNMLETMSRLKRFHNHFFNWYDTQTLETLQPEYISTVDSGNLCGHLMVLRQGLLELGKEAIFSQRNIRALADTTAILEESLPESCKTSMDWAFFLNELAVAQNTDLASIEEALGTARHICDHAEKAWEACDPEPGSEGEYWFTLLLRQCHALVAELKLFFLPREVLSNYPHLRLPTLQQMAELDIDQFPRSYQEEAKAMRDNAAMRLKEAGRLSRICGLMSAMDFQFLYDSQRELLTIGYNVNERRMDASYYDLLASEARLTYYVAIATGQISQASWFALGRMLTGSHRLPVLLSWSGSMFEYLMPILVMPDYEGSLLASTSEGAVQRQIEYGRELHLPWGISESGYNLQDANYNYQYRAFGVPGLGLKRGLAEDIVLAPYASVMALMVEPAEACENLQTMTKQGLAGRYGMYEAVDYTTVRLPRGKDRAIIYSFMAHHQGMAFLSLASLLLGQRMQQRFLAEPYFQASKLLLEERMPLTTPEHLQNREYLDYHAAHSEARTFENKLRIFKDPNMPQPAVQLLSNGRYHVMVSCAGGGYSRHHGLALTRWREDGTRDNWGLFCYLRDVSSGQYWSSTYQPVCRKTELYEAIFCDGKAEYKVREHDFDAHTEIVVSPEDDVELRRIHITNRGRTHRSIELTSYGEVVLNTPAGDEQHPAFSKLFIETEIVEELQALICSRRPSSSEQPRRYLFHCVAVHGTDVNIISYETDRSRFIGRGRDLSAPAALDPSGNGMLSNTCGAVLDPIIAIRCRIVLEAGASATLDFVTGPGDNREACVELIHKFRDKSLADRVFDLAWSHSQLLLHQSNATLYDAQLYEQLASYIIYPSSLLRAKPSLLQSNTRGQSGLWGQAISGDNPIVLVKISDSGNIDYVTQMVKAHSYWRMKGLIADLIIWNEDHYSYRQNLNDLILSVIPSGAEGQLMEKPGGIFVRSAQQMSREDRILIQSTARVIISDTGGTIAEQAYRRRANARLPLFCASAPLLSAAGTSPAAAKRVWEPQEEGSLLPNSYGGFSKDGTEYIITLKEGRNTPAPWVNVLANAIAGTIVSEGGSANTWRENAHEFRLTPWMNDPVQDVCGEAFYIRDEHSGAYWSPTPLPVRGAGEYTIRHGFGYSVFVHEEGGIDTELTIFMAKDDPVKISLLKIQNHSGRDRRLSATGYVEWVLGDLRAKSAMHVITDTDPISGAILAWNAYTMDFPGRVALFSSSARQQTATCDRGEFIGRNRSLARPAAMDLSCLSGRNGPGLDPCAAIQAPFEMRDGESVIVVFCLGADMDRESATHLARRYADVNAAIMELQAVREQWQHTLSVIQVETPNPAANVMANGWLVYQNMASRYLARSGYYQSGGAFGFRDQLQDSMALVYARPDFARKHLLLAAAHQFPEGDVMHWWHPPLDRGVRTRCSDDYLWLPLAVQRYIRITGDASVLDEMVEYIEGRQLNPGEESYYDLPLQSSLRESLYDHCVRAIRHGLRTGVHGLPLMGSGDWNDGMDRVGIEGRGESVWLGFFLYKILLGFAPVAEMRNDPQFASQCRDEADKLRENLESNAWDGSWYKRAYFDDGTPLGSASNEECRIDSIAQSWSILSGSAPDWRQHKALEALEANLVQREMGLIQLFTPPFDNSPLDPGYIKGYVPGVRENGGQYTHAAVWAVMAFAAMGEREKAWELANMINPVSHGDTPEKAECYKVEPYVIAADIYAVSPHQGRGGWSWYTGAAGWFYRLLVESLLGFTLAGDILRFKPLLPSAWDTVTVRYRHGSTLYTTTIRQDADVADIRVSLDGTILPEPEVPLIDDSVEHHVLVELPMPSHAGDNGEPQEQEPTFV